MKKVDTYDLPKTDEEWVKYIDSCELIALRNRRPYEFQWVCNIAYYLGYQNLVFNPTNGVLDLPGNKTEQPLVINRIGSFIEARHAKLTKNRPVGRVIPNTNDNDDKRAAKYSDQALMNLWRELDMDEIYDRVIMQMLLCGCTFAETMWDPLTGDFLLDDKRDGDTLIVDEDGDHQDKVFLGNVSTRPRSPFEVLVANETVPNIKDQEWVMTRTHICMLESQRLFPDIDIKPTDPMTSKTSYEKILERLGNPIFSSAAGKSAQETDQINSDVLVQTFMMKPNETYPKGYIVVKINDLIAQKGTFPNDYGKNVYPLVKFQEKTDGFHFYPQATVERLIPIQRAYNSIKEQTFKNAKIMAVGKWMNPKGSMVSEEAFTDESGEVIEFNPAVKDPYQATIAPLPNYIQAMPTELVSDFRDAGGQRESTVNPPPNLSAAVALQVAAEQADEVIGPIVRRLARSIQLVAEQQLILMNDEYIEPRKVKIIGDSGFMGVQYMTRMDLKNHTDIHIEVESMIPEFRGAKTERLLALWDRRIITDPKQFLRAYRFGNYDEIIEEDDAVEDMIVLDIEAIKRGKQPMIMPPQNHVMYVKKLSDWIQTPDFLRLIPERKRLALMVLQEHIKFLLPSLPNQGAPMEQQNQAAVGTPFGSQRPPGLTG